MFESQFSILLDTTLTRLTDTEQKHTEKKSILTKNVNFPTLFFLVITCLCRTLGVSDFMSDRQEKYFRKVGDEIHFSLSSRPPHRVRSRTSEKIL